MNITTFDYLYSISVFFRIASIDLHTPLLLVLESNQQCILGTSLLFGDIFQHVPGIIPFKSQK